jgi:hypothetical protein
MVLVENIEDALHEERSVFSPKAERRLKLTAARHERAADDVGEVTTLLARAVTS